jgi:acetylornithine deacetylase/succinyl-diaminopimelate desuccinylase-like protein
MAITGEPTNLQIIPAHCGLIFLDITARGRATHGSMPDQGVNAIDRIYSFVDGVRRIVASYPAHPLVGPASLNLGIMCGGDRPNRVPDRCTASVDIRLVPPMTVTELLNRINDYRTQWGTEIECRVSKQGSPLNTSPDSPLIGAVSCACKRIRHEKPAITGWRAWTETESFQSRLGIDAIVFGPGDLMQAHSADEFVDLAQVCDAAGVYAETAISLLR